MPATRTLDTRSVLFTDIVGSTELRARLGEDAADELRRAHDQLTTEVVSSGGGLVIKGLGDGIMATFTSAADAVTAAIGIQRATQALGARMPAERRLAVRVGISVGDVSHEDGDVFGGPVVEASRLCSAAEGNEILVAELVRALARGRSGTTFESVGELELKGLADPMPTCRVIWHPDPDEDREALSLPNMLTAAPRMRYVGRRDLVQHLRDSWAEVEQGACRTILLAGEPGIGKTRSAAELARWAHRRGALVLYGRCDEDLALPYQPFIEALDWYVTEEPSPVLGRLPGELNRLVPDLFTRVPGTPEPISSDPASEEHRLFEATASWLVQASAPNGLVLVLDDLHWAAAASLHLLVHLLRIATAGEGARIMVVGTYRDTDVDRTHPLSAMLGDLRRLPGVERIPVDGLTEDEVLAFIELAAGHDIDSELRQVAGILANETEGNPFFMVEVIRHLIETGVVVREDERWRVLNPERLSVPEGVRDVIGRRLTRLPESANAVLSIASVVGRDFDLELLLALVDLPEGDVLDALERAARARLIAEVGADRFRFGHALVRSVLYDELSATRRRRLHRRVADVLEKIRPDDVVALAHHAEEGGPEGGDLSRAIHYSLAAAEQALAGRAASEAESRYGHVLELLEEHVDERAELEALVGRGIALRVLADPAFREVLLTAARKARHTDHGDLLVRAVIENHRGMPGVAGGSDAERLDMIAAALEVVGDNRADCARLLATQASELSFSDDRRRLELIDQAKEIARELNDRNLLAWCVIRAGYANFDASRFATLPAYMEQVSQIADESGDPWLRAQSLNMWSAALAVTGDIVESSQRADEAFAAAQLGSPLLVFLARASQIRTALARGDLSRAEDLIAANLQLGQSHGLADAQSWWGAATAAVMWIRGKAGEMADLAGSFAGNYPEAPEWHIAYVWFLVEAGRIDEARAALAALDPDPAALVQRCLPFQGVTSLAWVAFLLDDAPLAAKVEAALTPYRGAWAHYYAASMGPVTLALAACACAQGRWDEAFAGFEEGLAALRAVGFTGIEARLQSEVAKARLKQAASQAPTD